MKTWSRGELLSRKSCKKVLDIFLQLLKAHKTNSTKFNICVKKQNMLKIVTKNFDIIDLFPNCVLYFDKKERICHRHALSKEIKTWGYKQLLILYIWTKNFLVDFDKTIYFLTLTHLFIQRRTLQLPIFFPTRSYNFPQSQ